MFTSLELENYAKVMIVAMKKARKKPFKPLDTVKLSYQPTAIPLAEKILPEIIKEGFVPEVAMVGENSNREGFATIQMDKDFFNLSNDDQLKYLPQWAIKRAETINGSIFLYSPTDLEAMKDVNPKRIAMAAKAKKPLKDILFKRERQGNFGWTLCLYPTELVASFADMTVEEYKDQIVRACYLDAEDPVKEWEMAFKEIKRICLKLNNMPFEYAVLETAKHKITFHIGNQRQWVGGDGCNIPSFEIFTSPNFKATTGEYLANMPSYKDGNVVENVYLKFREGRLLEASAEKGNDVLQACLDMDEGAKHVGEFSLTDRRLSRINKFMANTLFDENFGGNFGNSHIALGSSYEETFRGYPSKLSKEQKKEFGFSDSSLHWDLVNTQEKQVTAIMRSGPSKVIYRDGIFTV